MEDDHKKNGRQTSKSGRQPQKYERKKGRRPQAKFKKATLIGCDIIVN
jgi:hypothetical protein